MPMVEVVDTSVEIELPLQLLWTTGAEDGTMLLICSREPYLPNSVKKAQSKSIATKEARASIPTKVQNFLWARSGGALRIPWVQRSADWRFGVQYSKCQ
nr:hypothetical protein SHINE37_42383 [Rhizobiaceae bacterium]